jgi:hypothetical protein
VSAAWLDRLAANPLPALLSLGNPALAYFTRRDLLQDPVEPVESFWETAEARAILKKQQPDGSWRYPAKSYDPFTGGNYDLLETYRMLRLLVEMYSLDSSHPALVRAADYILACQTGEGDLRGILGNQYMPYYHGVILELLIKAGCGQEPGVRAGLDWLLARRQEDGGWLVPTQLVPHSQRTHAFWVGPPVQADPARPSSHLATGMALRAFVHHPEYRRRAEVQAAAVFLKSRFFQPDRYNDRKAPAYWLKFQFPFWWTNLLTALDALARLGFSAHDGQIARGLAWFYETQGEDGLWETGYGAGRGAAEQRAWVGLAVCRMLERFTNPGR